MTGTPVELCREEEMMSLSALRAAYGDLAVLASALDEQRSWQPTACLGWTVRDLLQHLLGDAQRALVALGTPSDGPADRTAVTYWQDSPGAPESDSRGIRATRTMASQWKLEYLTATYAESTAAVLTLATRASQDELLHTQGHVLSLADLITTLLVEATIHHLDLAPALADPGPKPDPLRVTRATLDALLGRPTPGDWDDSQWTRAATGRGLLTHEQQRWLGSDRQLLPLLR